MSNQEFIRVSLAEPCEICGAPDYCVRIKTSSGHIIKQCMRAEKSGKSSEGVRKVDSTGQEYHLFFPDGMDKGKRDDFFGSFAFPKEEPYFDATVLNEVYSTLLGLLHLRPEHLADLTAKRGYTLEEIESKGFKSVPKGRAEWEAFRDAFFAKGFKTDDLGKVPGFALTPDKSKIMIAEVGSGYFIPTRNSEGKIVKLIVRLDESVGSKYVAFSAATKGGPNAPNVVHFPVRPEGTDTSRVRIVGGVHKAEIAFKRSGVYTLGLASETSYKLGVKAAIDVLGAREVILSWDADARSNPGVAGPLVRGALAFAEAGLCPSLEVWSQCYGKGIDDVYLSDNQGHVEILHGQCMWKTLIEINRSAGKAPNLELESRYKLSNIVNETEKDPAAPFAPGIKAALSILPEGSREYQSLIQKIKPLMDGDSFRQLKRDIAECRDKYEGQKAQQRAKDEGTVLLDHWDHPALANHIIEDITLYGCKPRKEYLVYDGVFIYLYNPETGVYAPMDDSDVRKKVYDLSGAHLTNGQKLSISHSSADQIMRVLKDMTKKTDWFTKAPPGLAFTNGFITVDDKGELHLKEHSYTNRAAYRFNFDYVDGSGYLEHMQDFGDMLRRYWSDDDDAAEKMMYLQETIGAALFGDSTKYQKATIFKGAGGEGKSELLKVIKSMFPAGSVVSVNPQDMGSEYHRASLINRRLNIIFELPERELMDGSAIKAILSGDQISGRPIRCEPVYFTPICGTLLACNTLPPTQDTTKGFRRRWTILEFNKPILAEERVPDISNKIKGELPYIVRWAIDGYRRLVLNGSYTEVPSSEEALNKWLQQSDNVAVWMAENTISADRVKQDGKALSLNDKERVWTKARTLYMHYAQWAKESNHKPFSETKFGDKIKTILGLTPADCKCPAGNFYPLTITSESPTVVEV